MSESRKKYYQKLFFLSPGNIKYIAEKADARAPGAKGGARAQSSVIRDVIDFTEAHDDLFLTWLTTHRSPTSER